MNDVPLVKANNIHDINTSIIAIKKQLKQLNEAVGLIDMPTIDTSIFVKKSEVVDVVEEGNMNPVTSNAVVPVDEVTSGNMQSVSSNAVSKALSYSTTEHFTGKYWTDGKKIYSRAIVEEISSYNDISQRRDFNKIINDVTINKITGVYGYWQSLAGDMIGRQVDFGSTQIGGDLGVLWTSSFLQTGSRIEFFAFLDKNNYAVTRILLDISIEYTKTTN